LDVNDSPGFAWRLTTEQQVEPILSIDKSMPSSSAGHCTPSRRVLEAQLQRYHSIEDKVNSLGKMIVQGRNHSRRDCRILFAISRLFLTRHFDLSHPHSPSNYSMIRLQICFASRHHESN